jgi:hypothetical protein
VRITGLELFAVPPRWLLLKLSTAVKMNATAELHYLDSEARVEEAAERLAAARNQDGTVAEW